MSFPAYPKYKDSGVEWLGQIPDHWQVKRLRRVVELNPSKAEISHLPRELEVSFLPMEAIGEDGSLNLDRTKPIEDVETGYTYFRENDVSLAKITPCFENGKGAIMRGLHSGVGFGTTELIIARPDADQISSEYLNYIFSSVDFRQHGEAAMYGAGGQKRISDDFVRDFQAPLPPPLEQNEITIFLDYELAKIDALIEEQQALLGILYEKKQAFILRAVTRGINSTVEMVPSGVDWIGDAPKHWGIRSIKSITQVKRGASPRPIDDPRYFDDEGEFAWVRIADVSASSGILIDTTQRLSELGSSLSVKVFPGDLFVSIAGTVGKPCISGINACIHDGFVYFPGLNIDPKFLYKIFEAGTCYAGLGKMGTQLNLNTDTIGSIRIALPPVDEMASILQAIGKYEAEVDELIAVAKAGVKFLHERRMALITSAVTGKIDVRGFKAQEH